MIFSSENIMIFLIVSIFSKYQPLLLLLFTSVMLTRPTVSRPRPRPGNTRPRPRPEVFKAKASQYKAKAKAKAKARGLQGLTLQRIKSRS